MSWTIIQLFSDGAESTTKEVILFFDQAVCNSKEEIQKEKRLWNPEGHFITVWLPSNKQKAHGTLHYAKK